jgi:hypothetical protein
MHYIETIASKDPRAHMGNVRKEFRELIEHLRGDINKIDEPKANALFETAAEVIGSGHRVQTLRGEERKRLEIALIPLAFAGISDSETIDLFAQTRDRHSTKSCATDLS